MPSRFLYIDDASSDIRNATATALGRTGIVEVISEEPLPWDTLISRLVEGIDQLDGLILDWRLTEETNRVNIGSGGNAIKYSAEALAQHLRFLVTDDGLKDIPIVLCSANHGFKEYYKRDSTGHDLFDEVYEKNDFVENHDTIVRQLNCLAEAYKVLQLQTNNKPSWKTVFADPDNIDIDIRLIGKVALFLDNKVPHGLIRFILNEVVKTPGILIDEDILAARLGVDKDSSSDWSELLEMAINPKMKYQGLLANGWNRWWAEGLVQWWKLEINPTHPQFKAANQRVKLLKEKTGIKGLVPAEKLKFCTESQFWTVCVATIKPISTAEGLHVLVQNEQPWQDEQYVSLYAILERINPDSYKLNPLEKERLESLKKMLGKNG